MNINIALLQIMGFSLFFNHVDWFGHGFLCLAPNLLLSPFHKKLLIFETMSLVFAEQIIHDLVLSCIVIEEFNPFIHVRTYLTKFGS